MPTEEMIDAFCEYIAKEIYLDEKKKECEHKWIIKKNTKEQKQS